MSKLIWNHPAEPTSGRRYWRSLGELDDTPEFREWLHREFPQGATAMKDETDQGESRRDFLKLMGAATALAGFGVACRRPQEIIKPYARSVEWVIPGKATYYATAMPRPYGVTPIVATTHEGRPTHLAGNPLHPESNGSLDGFAQASILDLYDPDRSKHFLHRGRRTTKERFLKYLEFRRKKIGEGHTTAFLLDHTISPTRDRLLTKLKSKHPYIKFYRYEPIHRENETEAARIAFGAGVVPVPHFDVCEKVLSLESDFLGLERPQAGSVSRFMSGRRAQNPGDPMNRLYVLESRYTVTGGMADHRLRVHSSQMMKVAVAIAKEVASLTGDETLKKAAEAVKLTSDYQPRLDYDAWVKEMAKDLVASKGGKALVLVGAAQPLQVHLLGFALNQALGAMTKAAGKNHPPLELKQGTLLPAGTIQELAQAVKEEAVKTLFIIGQSDPCYDAPQDLSWPEIQKQIRTVFHLSTRHRTATARASRWHIPGTHYLEQWGDVRGQSGTYSVIQPMIMPLYGGISDLELITWLLQETPLTAPAAEAAPAEAPMNGATPAPSTDPLFLAVKETFRTFVKENVDDAWNQALKNGFVAKTEWPEATASVQSEAVLASLGQFVDTPPPSAQSMELTLVPDNKIYDGRYINNAWLQESPDPISKLVWDNAALVSVRTAHELGLDRKAIYKDQAQTIELTVGNKTLTVPVLIAPGHADHAITLALGYGQAGEGKDGPGRVGEATGRNAYIFRTSQQPYFIPGAKITLTGETMPIAVTQEHSTMYGRELVREGTHERFKTEPNFAYSEGADSHIPQDFSFYKQVGKVLHREGFSTPLLADTQHQWGMVIDLNGCIGCNSCAISCQSENNIPVVGKRQVMIGREMSWIRMDRYFAIDLDGKKNADGKEYEINEANDAGREREVDDPELLFQPVSCQHCEAAPCENVCPVNATVHSEDGLNLMVYNRCIGTRYCANNCPYKARRFNFFDYNKYDPLLNADGGRDNAQTNTGLFDLLHQNNLYKGPLGRRGDYESLKLQKNPNVTVRMRGVIEKCTYCIQRLEEAKINQRGKITKLKSARTGIVDEKLTLSDEELRIPTDSIKTACQEACPADSIVFGNLLDKNSAVAKLQNHPRRYQLLRYIGALPRTSYMARIKNPNPDLIAASAIEKRKVGQATANM